jgi:alanyl-tRNA synthetase
MQDLTPSSTRRLYQDDSYVTEFEGRVTAVEPLGGGYATVLGATYFYPETGGQPCDTGTLDGLVIGSVVESAGRILHVSGERPDFGAGDTVRGRIDWARRFTNMQQHTGQHILSQAFLRVLGAETVSSRLGTERSSVDVGRLDLSWDDMDKVERIGNTVVCEDREVKVYDAPLKVAEDLRLKAAPSRDVLRIIDIEGFDKAPCGGTHCRRTGEVGLIKVLRWERVRDTTRAEFVCGSLALADYFWKNRFIVDLAQRLTTKDTGLPQIVDDLVQAAKDQRKEIDDLRQKLIAHEISDIEARAEVIGGVRVVVATSDDRTASDLRRMAALLTTKAGMVALLASSDDGAHFVFSRSAGLDLDMRELIKVVTAAVGGRGGGRPEICEGGGKDATHLAEAMERAAQRLRSLLGLKA